jgi:uncharacterized protein (TIGR02594 family)
MAPGYVLPKAPPPVSHMPPWMDIARAYIGLKEFPGSPTAPAIRHMLAKLRAWWQDDETAWCGTFAGYCLQDAGLAIPKAWYRARAYGTYGRDVTATHGRPLPYGAIVVLSRGKNPAQGHVGFFVAPCRGDKGTLGSNLFWMLGGNQDNQVCVRAYPWSRVVATRWPKDYPYVDYRGPHSVMHGPAIGGGSEA